MSNFMAGTKACAVCGEALAKVEAASGVTWIHGKDPGAISALADAAVSGDLDPLAEYGDHVPVPVDCAEITATLSCDFCSDTAPTWLLKTEAITMRDPVGHLDRVTTEEWLVCGECAKLIESNQWNRVTQRTLHSVGPKGEQDPGLKAELTHLHRQVRKGMIGGLTKFDSFGGVGM